jgi:hypothetical protein
VSGIASAWKNIEMAQSARMRALWFNVGTQVRWYPRAMSQAMKPCSLSPYTWVTP